MNDNDSPNALNYLEPHKRLAQRIAIAQLRDEPIAQLRGDKLTDEEQGLVKQFLIDERILSEDEAQYYNFVANLTVDLNNRSTFIDLRELTCDKFTFNIFGASTPSPDSRPPTTNEILGFIESPSNQPPWSLTGTTTTSATLRSSSELPKLTKEELEEKLAELADKVRDTGSLFKILQPCKKLSQLIAETWIDGDEGDLDAKAVFTEGNSEKANGFLLGRGLISRFDAQYATNIIVDRTTLNSDPSSTGTVYVGELTVEKDSDGISNVYNVRIPYPEEPTDFVNNSQLIDWVNSPPGVPFTPVDFSRFIPLSC